MTLPARSDSGTRLATVKLAAIVVSAAFLLVGILGFIPGITSNYGMMHAAGPDSEAMLLGVFMVSVLHNIVHLAFGVVGIVLARTFSGAKWFLIVGGVVYLLLLIYGLVVPADSQANFVPINTADNWLHLALGVVMILLGLILGRSSTRSVTRDAEPTS